MIPKATILALAVNCSSSSSSPPSEPTYPGMCADYYAQLQREGNLLSREGRDWCQELCEVSPVQDRYECATMYCCLKIKDCNERYWDKPEYVDCLAWFGERPYRL
jgi:hypothetical protein